VFFDKENDPVKIRGQVAQIGNRPEGKCGVSSGCKEILRKAPIEVCRSDERYSATQYPDFMRPSQLILPDILSG